MRLAVEALSRSPHAKVCGDFFCLRRCGSGFAVCVLRFCDCAARVLGVVCSWSWSCSHPRFAFARHASAVRCVRFDASICGLRLPLRFCWHPRCVISLHASPLCGAGTYFSLPPQRKVGKRKRLTPPALDLCPRAPNVPTLHTATPRLLPVANASNERLTRFKYPHSCRRQRMVCAAQVANCV